MMRRLVIAALLTGACLAAGGCGGGSKTSSTTTAGSALSPADSAFKRAFMAQLVPLRTVGTELSVALGTAPRDSDAKLRRSFAGLARATGPILTGLGTLQAPPRYRADLSVMRTSLARARRDLRAVALTAAAHQAAALKRALNRLTHDSAVVKAADHRLSVALGISS